MSNRSLLAIIAAFLTLGVSLVLTHQEREAARAERKDMLAATLQARNLPDARRVLTHREQEERAKAQLDLQKVIIQNGGLLPDPNAKATGKPLGI